MKNVDWHSGNDDLEVPFNMILSATMFQNLIYEIDDKNHKLNVTIPDEESTETRPF